MEHGPRHRSRPDLGSGQRSRALPGRPGRPLGHREPTRRPYHVRSTPPAPFAPGDLVVWGSGNLGVIATADGFVDVSADALNSLGDFRTAENNVPGILTIGRDGDAYFLPTGPGEVTTFDEVVFSIPGQQALRFSAGSVNHTSRGFELTHPIYWGKPLNGFAISQKRPHGR